MEEVDNVDDSEEDESYDSKLAVPGFSFGQQLNRDCKINQNLAADQSDNSGNHMSTNLDQSSDSEFDDPGENSFSSEQEENTKDIDDEIYNNPNWSFSQ